MIAPEVGCGEGPINVVSVPAGHRRTIVPYGAAPLIISPDGRRVAYHTDFDGNQPYGSV